MIDTKFWLYFLTLIGLFSTTQTAQAQTYQPTNRAPVSDNTLGTQVSGAGGNFDITGGVSKGQTLFHSFTDFSVPTSGQANFLNPVGNRDIITRVTGNLFSDINGSVNTNGANFFLINPSGIVFGPNAQLNVGKAFVGSTANSLDLVGGGRTITFGTNPNGDAPLLSVAPNVLFDVARLNLGGGSGAISNFGTLQTTNQNQYIGLIGGNVNLNGGQIIAPGGRVELGGLSAAGAVGFSREGNNLRAQFPTNVGRADVSLTNQAKINVVGTGEGNVTITARNIDLLGGSNIGGGIEEGLGTPETVAGDIKLNATGKIAVVGSGSGIANGVNSKATGQGGSLIIDAGSFLLQDRAAIGTLTVGKGNAGNISIKTTGDLTINGNNNVAGISSSTSGQGNTGKITIDAQGNILLANSGSISAAISSEADGNSQGINIAANNLNLLNKGFISSNSFGNKGNAGDIKIKVSESINIDGLSSSINSAIKTGTVGDGGSITIDAASVSLRNGAKLETSTYGTGNAGNVTVNAKNAVSLINGDIFSTVEAGGVGKGGDININAGSLSLKDSAQLLSVTRGASTTQPAGRGDAGNINVKVTRDVNIAGKKDRIPSGIRSSAGTGSVGNGGNIIITAGSFSLQDDAQLQASIYGQGNAGTININTNSFSLGKATVIQNSTWGQGNAGNIKITAKDAAASYGFILSTVEAGGVGNGGNIDINANSFSLKDGAQLKAVIRPAVNNKPAGRGDAGNINLKVSGTVDIADSNISGSYSGIFTFVDKGAKGNGGDITIDAGNLSLLNTGRLLSSNFGQGNAGNILLNSGKVLLNKGDIFSTSSSTTGGNITIKDTDYLILRNNSSISTNSVSTDKNGNGGNITISSPVIAATPGNNDITANANQGAGGQVKITSQGLFGIQFRPKGQASPLTSDITASSTFGRDGAVNVSTPGTDPGKDSTKLPNATTDSSNQISQVCGANTRENKLTVTGRGGLPPTANDPLTSDVVWQDARAASPQPVASSAKTNPAKLAAPAVGWVFDGKGKVTLVAAGTQGQPTGTSVVCPPTK
jgi:filamentous hemagglutinin family protein